MDILHWGYIQNSGGLAEGNIDQSLGKDDVLIRVSQEHESQPSWATRLEISEAAEGLLCQDRESQGPGTSSTWEPGICLRVPSLMKQAVSMTTCVFQLLCLSKQSSTQHLWDRASWKSEWRKISFLQNKLDTFHPQIVIRFLPTSHPRACLNWFWWKPDPFS